MCLDQISCVYRGRINMTVLDIVVDSQDNTKHISVLTWHFAYVATARNISHVFFTYSPSTKLKHKNSWINCQSSVNNNNNEYLERLTRTGPKRLHVLYKYILSKFNAYNMNAHTYERTHTETRTRTQARAHTHKHTHIHTPVAVRGQWDWRKGF